MFKTSKSQIDNSRLILYVVLERSVVTDSLNIYKYVDRYFSTYGEFDIIYITTQLNSVLGGEI